MTRKANSGTGAPNLLELFRRKARVNSLLRRAAQIQRDIQERAHGGLALEQTDKGSEQSDCCYGEPDPVRLGLFGCIRGARLANVNLFERAANINTEIF